MIKLGQEGQPQVPTSGNIRLYAGEDGNIHTLDYLGNDRIIVSGIFPFEQLTNVDGTFASGQVPRYDGSDFIPAEAARYYVVTATSSPYTAVAGDCVLVNLSGTTPVTVNLPTSPSRNDEVIVKKVDDGTNLVYVSGTGGATVDGQAAHEVSGQYDAARFISDGTDWFVIG